MDLALAAIVTLAALIGSLAVVFGFAEYGRRKRIREEKAFRKSIAVAPEDDN